MVKHSCIATFLLGALLMCPMEAFAQRQEPLPKELEGVGITEHLGSSVPRDLVFNDERGQKVKLGDYLDKKIPTILTLNYSNCPMLCSVQLNGFVKGLRDLKLPLGERFQIITVSLDPTETPERASKTKARYLEQYGRPGAEAGWHFLVGEEKNVRTLASTVGFGYRYSEERKEYLHSPALILLSPEGKVSRYLYGLVYDAKTLRLGILEASEGKEVSTVDKLVLFCFHYDSQAGKYAPVARNVMRLGGGLFLLVLLTVLGVFWLRERVRQKDVPQKADRT